MTMQSKLFHAVPAFVGKVLGEHEVAFWPDDPRKHSSGLYDTSELLKIDVSRSPTNATSATWDQLEADDHYVLGGASTIGPIFPQGEYEGALYVTEDYLDRVGVTWAIPEDFDARDYEFQTVVYRDERGKLRRYRGAHAQILRSSGTSALVLLYVPGGSFDAQPKVVGPEWLELGDADLFDAPAHGLSKISIDGEQEGPLFMESGIYFKFFGRGPKIPAGDDAVEQVRRYRAALQRAASVARRRVAMVGAGR